jgi:hypothetical protein
MGIGPLQGRYLHETTQIQNKLKDTQMPRVGYEPTFPLFERPKTFSSLDLILCTLFILLVLFFIIVGNSELAFQPMKTCKVEEQKNLRNVTKLDFSGL